MLFSIVIKQLLFSYSKCIYYNHWFKWSFMSSYSKNMFYQGVPLKRQMKPKWNVQFPQINQMNQKNVIFNIKSKVYTYPKTIFAIFFICLSFSMVSGLCKFKQAMKKSIIWTVVHGGQLLFYNIQSWRKN